MHRRLVGTLVASLLLVSPLAIGAVWLFSDPLYGHADQWHVRVEVTDVEPLPVANRFEPIHVAKAQVLDITREGAGATPRGTIDIALQGYEPGVDEVRAGRTLTVAMAHYRMHDPETSQTTFEGFSLEDVRASCCWASRVGQMDVAAALLLLCALAGAGVVWGAGLRAPWPALAVSVATGAIIATLAAAWSNETLTLIQGDGEENYTISTLGLLMAAAAWAGLATVGWLAHRQPLAWAVVAGFALAFPLASVGGGEDVDLGMAALVVPLGAIGIGLLRAHARWVAFGLSAALLLPIVWLLWGAYRAPYRPELVTGLVLMVAFAGIFLPLVFDGLWGCRPAPPAPRAPAGPDRRASAPAADGPPPR